MYPTNVCSVRSYNDIYIYYIHIIVLVFGNYCEKAQSDHICNSLTTISSKKTFPRDFPAILQ